MSAQNKPNMGPIYKINIKEYFIATKKLSRLSFPVFFEKRSKFDFEEISCCFGDFDMNLWSLRM